MLIAALLALIVADNLVIFAILLVVQKLTLLALMVVSAVRFSMLVQLIVLANSIVILAVVVDKSLVLLNSAIATTMFTTSIDLIDVLLLMFGLYATQTVTLLLINGSSSALTNILTAILVFGIPVTLANLTKMILIAISDISEPQSKKIKKLIVKTKIESFHNIEMFLFSSL